MAFVRQSLRTRPPFGELGDPPLPNDGNVLYEEEYLRVPNVQYMNKPKKSNDTSGQKDTKRILKTSSRKELAHADRVERLLIDDSVKKQLRRRSCFSSSSNSSYVDDPLEDYNHDWFFEKMLEKFEEIRSRKTQESKEFSSNEFNGDVNGGGNNGGRVERIVERRYYVKKAPSQPKRNQITSTTDLRTIGKKNRLSSGVSSATATSSAYSRCSTSTPTYIGNLREQSDSLRHDFTELKNEIEQLLISQQDFFLKLENRIQTKTENIPTNNSKKTTPPIIGKRSRSISTESQTSEASSTSGASTLVPQTTEKAPPVTPSAPVSEFIANKSPSYVPAPPVTSYAASKSSSAIPTSPANPSLNSKASSVTPTPPVNAPVTSKPPLIPRASSVNTSTDSKPPSIAPTPPVNPSAGTISSRPPTNGFAAPRKLSIDSVTSTSAESRHSSEAPTPLKALSPKPSARIPVYENEVALRRTLSPHTQIVASSASGLDSYASSTRSNSSLSIQSISHSIIKIPPVTLGDKELNDLVQYSSQLELSGFPPSITPVITDPNTNSTFWDSVDHYINNPTSTNAVTDSPTSSIRRSYYGTSFGLNNNTTRQLDKYDLEIKPQETVIPSAPLLLPPLDILP